MCDSVYVLMSVRSGIAKKRIRGVHDSRTTIQKVFLNDAEWPIKYTKVHMNSKNVQGVAPLDRVSDKNKINVC